MPAGTHWLAGGANAIFAFLAKKIFYKPVFKRVKGDDCQSTSRAKNLNGQRERFLHRLKLVIDYDSQGLEGLRGRMVGTPPGQDPLDYGCQLTGSFYRPGGDNSPGNPS
jgi:hypothetical protein